MQSINSSCSKKNKTQGNSYVFQICFNIDKSQNNNL